MPGLDREKIDALSDKVDKLKHTLRYAIQEQLIFADFVLSSQILTEESQEALDTAAMRIVFKAESLPEKYI